MYKLKDCIDINNLDWSQISENPTAIFLLEKNQDKIDWNLLSLNPSAIYLLAKNLNKICWYYLSLNPSAIHLLEKNQDKINWFNLSRNPNATHLVSKNEDKVNRYLLSGNPEIINLLNEYKYKNYFDDEFNPGANYYLKKYQKELSEMKSIFELDYDFLKERCSIYKEELIKTALHSSRIE